MDITSSSSSDLSDDETSSSDYELENASVLTSEELLSPISDDCDTDLILDISMDSDVLPSSNDHYTEERFDHQVTKDMDKEFGYIVVGDNLDQTVRPRWVNSNINFMYYDHNYN